MALVKVRYTGHHDEVVVTDPDTGERYTCKRNGTVEVPEALAGGPVKGTGLLAQTDAWEKVDTERKVTKETEPAIGGGEQIGTGWYPEDAKELPVEREAEPAPRRRGG